MRLLDSPRRPLKDVRAIVTPIDIAGERLGTLFIYKQDSTYSIDDIILRRVREQPL